MKRMSFALHIVAGLLLQTAALAAPGQLLTGSLDNVVSSYVSDHHFRGSVLVVKKGEILLRKGYGVASEAWQVSDSADTRYEIASLTKQFTGAAILQLAASGKLKLDDPVSRYYAAAPASWKDVTVRELANHTSGLPNNEIKDFTKGITVPYSWDELLATFRDRPLAFRPGTGWAYTNTEYYLLAYIIEKLSGESYGAYLQHHIFGPAGMNNSGYAGTLEVVPHEAEGYTSEDGHVRRRDYFDRSLESGAGGIYTAVDDMRLWNEALSAGKLLDEASMQAMFAPSKPGSYGFGWFIDLEAPRRAYHEGSDPGFAAFEIRFLDERSLIVVLSNQDDAPVREIAIKLQQLIARP